MNQKERSQGLIICLQIKVIQGFFSPKIGKVTEVVLPYAFETSLALVSVSTFFLCLLLKKRTHRPLFYPPPASPALASRLCPTSFSQDLKGFPSYKICLLFQLMLTLLSQGAFLGGCRY